MNEVSEVMSSEVKKLQGQLAAVEKNISVVESELGKLVQIKTRIMGAIEWAQSVYKREISKEDGAGKEHLTS